jgi:hypothetical protein
MAERLKLSLLEGRVDERTGEKEERMVDVVCGPDAYRSLPSLLGRVEEEGEGGRGAANVQLSADETYADITPLSTDPSKKTANLTIMRGCNNMCSYCIVPFTRGMSILVSASFTAKNTQVANAHDPSHPFSTKSSISLQLESRRSRSSDRTLTLTVTQRLRPQLFSLHPRYLPLARPSVLPYRLLDSDLSIVLTLPASILQRSSIRSPLSTQICASALSLPIRKISPMICSSSSPLVRTSARRSICQRSRVPPPSSHACVEAIRASLTSSSRTVSATQYPG